MADKDERVVSAVAEYFDEAESAKRSRTELNKRNMATYLGQQDWSHKLEGQSTEFLPKSSVAVEQFTAFVKRALVQFGHYFSVKGPRFSPLSDDQIRSLLNCYLENIPDGAKTTSLPIRISDAVKSGIIGSLLIFKVHGRTVKETKFSAGDDGNLIREEISPYRLMIDVLRTEDYYPDPTGRNLYEIHRSEEDLHDVIKMSEGENAIYDKRVVNKLKADFKRKEEDDRRAVHRNQNEEKTPGFRKRVVIDEFWGTILDKDGKVLHENVVCAVANEKFLIRKPEPNPNWHGESPFVTCPLLRVPHSVWHRALMDDASPLNEALNEIFNLMLDGGLSAVWGIKQIREDWLSDPGQVSGGIAQGTTLVVNDSAPVGAKVLEQLTEGEIPQAALALFSLMDREHQSSLLTNEIQLGNLPDRTVKATEIVQASQNAAVTLDSISADIEIQGIREVIRKGWLNILQNADTLATETVIQAIGPRATLALAKMSPAERFARYAGRCEFKVSGLSATLARTRDFQKLMSLVQIARSDPAMGQAFFTKYSPDKILAAAMRLLNFDPSDLERDEEEIANLPDELEGLRAFAEITNAPGQPGGSPSNSGSEVASLGGPQTAGGEVPAEINQISNPIATLVAG